jgi:hypothetical protein
MLRHGDKGTIRQVKYLAIQNPKSKIQNGIIYRFLTERVDITPPLPLRKKNL